MFRSFQAYLEAQQEPTDTLSTYILGGFVPGQIATPLLEATDEDEPEDVSKSPIMFDNEDMLYLTNFPPEFWAAALSHRYGDAAFSAKKAEEEGQAIPDVYGNVPIKGRGKTNLHFPVQESEHLSPKKLLEKLERPRDLDALMTMSPEEAAENYNGGLYGFDLSEGVQAKGQWVGKSYLGLTKEGAKAALNDWRYGAVHGFLNHDWVDSGAVSWKPVSFGGGKPPSNPYFVDWNGQLQRHLMKSMGDRENAMLMPVWTPEALRDILGIGGEHLIKDPDGKYSGKIRWDYAAGDDRKATENYLPIMSPGILTNTSALKQYRGQLNSISEVAKKHGMESQQVEQYLAEANKIRNGAADYYLTDWLVHHYNRTIDPETGKQKYPRMHTTGRLPVSTLGGVHVMKQQRERIKGDKKDIETLTKYFVNKSYDSTTGKFLVDRPDGGSTESAIVKGVDSYLSAIHGTHEGYALNLMRDELIQSAMGVVKSLGGDPFWSRAAKVLRDEAEVPRDMAANKEDLWKKVYNEIAKRSRNFAAEVGQYDWGAGTRRNRRSGIIVSYNAATSQGTEFSSMISTKQKLRGVGVDPKHDIRKRTSLRNITDEAKTFLKSGHALETIRENISKIKEMRKTRESIPAKDLKAHTDAMRIEAGSWDKLHHQYFVTYITDQLQRGNQDFAMADAIKFANANTMNDAKEAGIKINPKDFEASPAMQERLEREKQEIIADFMQSQQQSGQKTTVQKSEPTAQLSSDLIYKLAQDPMAFKQYAQMAANTVDPSKKAEYERVLGQVEDFKKLTSPVIVQRIKSDPQALQRMQTAASQATSPEERAKMQAVINFIQNSGSGQIGQTG